MDKDSRYQTDFCDSTETKTTKPWLKETRYNWLYIPAMTPKGMDWNHSWNAETARSLHCREQEGSW